LIVADETPWRGKEVEENDRVTQAIIDRRPIIGISNNAAFLPKNFIRAERTRSAIDTPTREMIENVAACMTNTSCATTISPEAVEAAEPTTLRLAMRPGQTAGDFLARLERLVPAQAARSEIKLTDLPGIGEAADWGRALAQDIRDYKAGKISWTAIDKGALLYGYPGTGKTTFAKAVAAECGLPLLATSYAAWQSEREGHLGDVIRALRRAFDQARQQAPSILFIDEIDSLGTRNSSSRHDEWWRAIVNALLEQLDGLAGREGVIVIAASNHPDHLDPALRRSGRLDKMIEIPLPDRNGLAAIMRAHLGDDLRHADLSEAAAHAHVLGATGADVEKWVRGARRRARQENREVDAADLVAELPAEADDRTVDARLQTAVHEIGHAIMRECCFPGTVEFVTIRQSGIISGIVKSVIKVELLSEEVVQNHLVCKLAGRAAEEVVFGQPSGSAGDGPSSDLADATMLAFSAVTSLAFDGDLVWRGVTDIYQMTQLLHLRPDVAGRVSARLKTAYECAMASLSRRKEVLQAAALSLADKKSLTGEELRSFLGAPQAEEQEH
jgi:ATP-dependent Zn protease